MRPGPGKEWLARAIHAEGRRSTAPFVAVNCAALPESLLESELFGHKRGAFTGAAADRPGLLREAHGGLLFLDEIGELGPDEQAMLLRALEEGTFLPVGSDSPVQSRFQLIAGTNRDLRRNVAAGTFREDLLSRINLWTFALPALRDRPEDIAPNLDYELRAFGQREGRAASFNKEAREHFLNFAEHPATPWRGNFRDLNAAVTRMATLAPRNRIGTDQVDAEIARLEHSWQRPDSNTTRLADDLDSLLPQDTLDDLDPFDRVQLAFAVATCRESRSLSAAGRTLFAASRQKKSTPNDADRLRKYLARFGLRFDTL